jgi:hypothetical protein
VISIHSVPRDVESALLHIIICTGMINRLGYEACHEKAWHKLRSKKNVITKSDMLMMMMIREGLIHLVL